MNRRAFLAGIAVLPACAGTRLEPAERRHRAVDPGPVRPRLTRPGEVPVLLVAARGREQLAILDAVRGATTFLRAGELVLASDGRAEERLDLEPRSASTGLGFDGRSYPGRFVVQTSASGGLELINLVDLEDYVEAVVAAELSIWSAEPDELAAQAVCVRTYALSTLARRGEVTSRPVLFDSTLDQAYRGRHRPADSDAARRVARKLRDATLSTRGLVLERGDRLEDARFHAACGGRTADPVEVFGDDALPGLVPVECPPCLRRAEAERAAGAPSETRPLGWERAFTLAELGAAARRLRLGSRMLSVAPARVDRAGRWLAAEVHGRVERRRVPLDELRAAFGPVELKSARILSTRPRAGEALESSWTVRGLGRGHGVGMCQEGARDLARAGWNFHRILAHYYPGARLERRIR